MIKMKMMIGLMPKIDMSIFYNFVNLTYLILTVISSAYQGSSPGAFFGDARSVGGDVLVNYEAPMVSRSYADSVSRRCS